MPTADRSTGRRTADRRTDRRAERLAAAAAAGLAARTICAPADRLPAMTPRAWRSGGSGVRLVHASSRCRLGRVLVATSDRGIAAVLLGDSDAVLVAELAARFPAAERVSAPAAGGDDGMAVALARVVALIERPATGLGLPLDIRGTVFQQRVWQALAAIPPGTTRSYTGIARSLGQPQAVRAVAAACAANPLAVAIPCHRAVRADGGLAGYRWGLAAKRRLLAVEAAATPGEGDDAGGGE